ncbi:unnamed protein product, partial [Ectocarpus sp. 12 AP-2014]
QGGGSKCGSGARNRDGEIVGEDEAARRIQRTERRRQRCGRVSSQRQERNGGKDMIGEDVAARRIQSRARRWNTKGHEKLGRSENETTVDVQHEPEHAGSSRHNQKKKSVSRPVPTAQKH